MERNHDAFREWKNLVDAYNESVREFCKKINEEANSVVVRPSRVTEGPLWESTS